MIPLNAAIKKNRPVLANRKQNVFYQDNEQEIVSHPPFSLNIAPTDDYRFP